MCFRKPFNFVVRIPQNPCPWTTFLCGLVEIPLKVHCYFQLKLCWPCSGWSCESSSSIFFTYPAPPAIPHQLQAQDITSKGGGSRLSNFYGCLGDPSLVWRTLMDWILMESDFFTLSDCHRLYVKTLYACFFASWVCQAHVLMCSVSEMVLLNLIWILGWTDFLLYLHLFCKTFFATVLIRGTYCVWVISIMSSFLFIN